MVKIIPITDFVRKNVVKVMNEYHTQQGGITICSSKLLDKNNYIIGDIFRQYNATDTSMIMKIYKSGTNIPILKKEVNIHKEFFDGIPKLPKTYCSEVVTEDVVSGVYHKEIFQTVRETITKCKRRLVAAFDGSHK